MPVTPPGSGACRRARGRRYVRSFVDYTAVHGAIGAVIVLMLWFYLSGFALLVGAELNAEIDKALHPAKSQAPGKPKAIGPAADRPGEA